MSTAGVWLSVEKRLVVSEKDRMLVPLSKMLEGSSDRAGEAYVGLDNIDARSSDTKEGEYCVRDAVTGRRSVWNYTGLPLAVAIRGMRRHLKIESENVYSLFTGTPTWRNSCESCVAEYLLARCLAICSSFRGEAGCGDCDAPSSLGHGPGDILAGDCGLYADCCMGVSVHIKHTSNIPWGVIYSRRYEKGGRRWS